VNTEPEHSHLYTALFCEENIWQLADSLIQQAVKPSDLSILFISNPDQQVAIFQQKSAAINEPVIWDYHVVLLRKIGADFFIYDFDSRLGFKTSADDYLSLSFLDQELIKEQYHSQFRLTSATSYLQNFSSDRSHMKGVIPEDQFPSYPPIETASPSNKITLQQYINFNQPLTDDESLLSVQELSDFLFKN